MLSALWELTEARRLILKLLDAGYSLIDILEEAE